MYSYRIVKTGDCEVELQSIFNSPIIKPGWVCEKYLKHHMYYVIMETTGKCVVVDVYNSDYPLVGFFSTDGDGIIKSFVSM